MDSVKRKVKAGAPPASSSTSSLSSSKTPSKSTSSSSSITKTATSSSSSSSSSLLTRKEKAPAPVESPVESEVENDADLNDNDDAESAQYNDEEVEEGAGGGGDENRGSEYYPPPGFKLAPYKHKKNNPVSSFEQSLIEADKDLELVLIRVPADFEIQNLSNIKLNHSLLTGRKSTFRSGEDELPVSVVTVPSRGKGPDESFGIYKVNQGAEVGSAGGELAKKGFSHYLSVVPTFGLPSQQELEQAGMNLLSEKYVPRENPKDMKVQYVPFGSDADGQALDQAMERYHARGAKRKGKEPAVAVSDTPSNGKKKRKVDAA
ncbi:hypothetical protein DFJ73DRAFT_782502 [Zopfochytrium polystomum]|nr:hypothetical protein DFJ73DRAFT_782502 [Zopfochytrium polystomum]